MLTPFVLKTVPSLFVFLWMTRLPGLMPGDTKLIGETISATGTWELLGSLAKDSATFTACLALTCAASACLVGVHRLAEPGCGAHGICQRTAASAEGSFWHPI